MPKVKPRLPTVHLINILMDALMQWKFIKVGPKLDVNKGICMQPLQ